MVGAPTALSNRLRGEANGYWLIEVGPAEVTLQLRRRVDENFVAERTERIERKAPRETPEHAVQMNGRGVGS
jgi:hypothetical protein